MKKYLRYSAFLLAAFAFLLTNCSKEVGPNHLPNVPALTRTPIPLFTVDPSSDLFINVPSEFKVKFSIGLYFPDDVKAKPESLDIVVARNHDYNYADIKTLKGDITTFPTEVNLTGNDLATIFGMPIDSIKGGDSYEIRVDFKMPDGTVIHGFPNGTSAIDASSDVKNFPGSTTSLLYNAVCPIDVNNFLGDMVVEDKFFWGDKYPVTVTLYAPNVLKVSGINTVPTEYILINLNPDTFVATVDDRVIDPAPPFFAYHNLSASGSGTIDACRTIIDLTLDWEVSEGSFGSGPGFSLHKPD